MRAWLIDKFEGLANLRMGEVAEPVAEMGEVVIDLQYAALNPADYYLAQGQYPAQPKLPHVLGRDGIGTISKVGAGAEQFQIGQRVMILRGDTGVSRWGTFAQKVAVAVQSIAIPPVRWTDEEAGCAALAYMTAHQALTQWGSLPPSMVLISGASGGVGIAALQLAKALKHTVVSLSRKAEKRERLKQVGADYVVDPNEAQWPVKLKQAIAPRRVDLAVDNMGGAEFGQVIETLGKGGKVSVVGQLAGPVPQFSTASLFFRRIRIGGVAAGSFTPGEARVAWEESVAMLNGIKARPIVDRVFPFEQLPAAFDRLKAGPFGKVLIKIPG